MLITGRCFRPERPVRAPSGAVVRQNGISIAGTDVAAATAAVIRSPVNTKAITLTTSHRALDRPYLFGFTVVGMGLLRSMWSGTPVDVFRKTRSGSPSMPD